MKRRNDPIEEQAQRVRNAYSAAGGREADTKSPAWELYLAESEKLSEMRALEAAANFRKQRGLPPSAKTPYDPREAPPARRLGENQFGLDVGYFAEVVRRDLSDLSNKRPEELARICLRIAETAASHVLAEPEFVSNFAKVLGLDGPDLARDAGVGRLLRKLKAEMPTDWGVNLSLGEDGFRLSLLTPDGQEQIEASGLRPESGGLRAALACLVADMRSGACMREYVERASSQTPEAVKKAVWALALDEGDTQAARALIAGFDGYQSFEDWFTMVQHYEMEDGDHEFTAADRAALRIAFNALRMEIDPLGDLAQQYAEQPITMVYESIPAGLSPRG